MEQIDLPSQAEDIVNLTTDAGIILAKQSVLMDSEPNMTNVSARPSETADVFYLILDLFLIVINSYCS